MNRRRLLAAVGAGTAAFAGCLSRESAQSAGPPAEPPADAQSGDCPETDVEPPTDPSSEAVTDFLETFEEDWIAASAPENARRSGSVSVETTAVEDGVARVDASVGFSGRGWDGAATIRPLEDGEKPTETGESGDEAAIEDDSERASTADERIAETGSLLETIESVVEDGEPRTVDGYDALEALTTAGEYLDDFLLEHDGEVLYVENEASVWESHGEWFVGYLLTDDAVYRAEHDPDAWNDRAADEPIDVPEDEWERLECWS